MWLFIYQSIHPSSFPLRQPWVKTHLPITPSFRSNIRHSNTYHTGPVGEGEMNDWLWFALSWNPVLRGFIGHFTLKWSWISILLSHGYQLVSVLSERVMWKKTLLNAKNPVYFLPSTTCSFSFFIYCTSVQPIITRDSNTPGKSSTHEWQPLQSEVVTNHTLPFRIVID